jgi:hypothetical protein
MDIARFTKSGDHHSDDGLVHEKRGIILEMSKLDVGIMALFREIDATTYESLRI